MMLHTWFMLGTLVMRLSGRCIQCILTQWFLYMCTLCIVTPPVPGFTANSPPRLLHLRHPHCTSSLPPLISLHLLHLHLLHLQLSQHLSLVSSSPVIP